jgi:integrase
LIGSGHLARDEDVRSRPKDRRLPAQLLLTYLPDGTTDSDIEGYRQVRAEGRLGLKWRPVSPRTVQADLVALITMLNWATRQRGVRGEPLLAANPLQGVRLPIEKNPRRPVETYDRFLQLMEVAGDVDRRLPCALALAECTGHRIGSILSLRRADVELDRLPYGWIRFRPEWQKTGWEHRSALDETGRKVVAAYLREAPLEPDDWLFPAARRPDRPVTVSVMSKLLKEAYQRAGLTTPSGALWHCWRRKWTTERKDTCRLRTWRPQEAGGM